MFLSTKLLVTMGEVRIFKIQEKKYEKKKKRRKEQIQQELLRKGVYCLLSFFARVQFRILPRKFHDLRYGDHYVGFVIQPDVID